MRVVEQQADVLIVGAGLAGARAAIAARDAAPDAEVVVAAPALPGQGGCGWETHGVHAAVLGDDTPDAHLADTLAAGAHLNHEPLARVLCEGMPEQIAFLREHGVAFGQLTTSAEATAPEYAAGRYGGSSVSRSLHLCDMTGLVISQTMLNLIIRRGVTVLSRHWLLDLLLSDDGCEGALLLDARHDALHVVRAGAVVLATGGGACMYPARSVSDDKRVTGIACALRAGVPIIDLEMVQFHPTGFRNDDGPGHGALLEEELRTQGGLLRDRDGTRFMPLYDARAELATRDVVARAIFSEMAAGPVTLDLGAFDPRFVAARFPNTVRRLRAFGFDLLRETQVPVTPSAHFLMGGAAIDERATTAVPRLLCCGEDAGGVHGANRMGGNGVAEALVFGSVAGTQAAAIAAAHEGDRAQRSLSPVTVAGTTAPQDGDAVVGAIRSLMWKHCSPLRTTVGIATLNRELDALGGFAERRAYEPTELAQALGRRSAAELQAISSVDNVLLASRAIARAARWRRNSVGSHFLSDGRDDWALRGLNSSVRMPAARADRLLVTGWERRMRSFVSGTGVRRRSRGLLRSERLMR